MRASLQRAAAILKKARLAGRYGVLDMCCNTSRSIAREESIPRCSTRRKRSPQSPSRLALLQRPVPAFKMSRHSIFRSMLMYAYFRRLVSCQEASPSALFIGKLDSVTARRTRWHLIGNIFVDKAQSSTRPLDHLHFDKPLLLNAHPDVSNVGTRGDT